MSVTTKQDQQLESQVDDAFAKQLESMLESVSATRGKHLEPVEPAVLPSQVSIDEVVQRANDGISLAQIVDVTMQEAGELLAQLYYQIEAASQTTDTNYVDLNNNIRSQIEAVDSLFAGKTFQQQAIFRSPASHRFPTGLNTQDEITLQIPNTALNQLGAKSWQLCDGPVLPIRQHNNLSFRFTNLKLQQGQRVRLLLGEADVLEECLFDLNVTMQTVADLINQAELDWLNQAIIQNGIISVYAPDLEQANLSIEAPAVAIEDSLAMLQVQTQAHTQKALQVIVGAINTLADYRDIAVSVANQLYQSVNELMAMPKGNELNAPLADAMVKDVQNMFTQQPARSMVAQANIKD